MKIAIIGYGKMGKMIESIAGQKGHTIGSCIDVHNQELLHPDNLRMHDVAIEFSTPGEAFGNVSRCLDAGLPVVCGTTGWTKHLEKIKERCRKENGSFLYASNFSLGVNILFHLNRQLAIIMNRHEEYHARLREIHHIQKLDAPSGTAITLADAILGAMDRLEDWSLKAPASPSGKTKDETSDPGTGNGMQNEQEIEDERVQRITRTEDKAGLVIESVREGTVPGIHEVTYESDFDCLSIRHSAKDRRGFAIGAILAAEYILGKKGVFTMKDVLDL